MENQKLRIVEECGLSQNQAKVYLALLGLGNSTATAVIEKSKLHRPNVYDALEQLIQKGLVTYVIQNNIKYFQANDPDSLLNLLKEKELKIESILPELKLKQKFAAKTKAHIFEGISGIKAVTDIILENIDIKKSVLTFGIPNDVSEKMKNFLERYHNLRIEKEITQYHIYNENAQGRIHFLNKMPYTKAAFLPKEYDSPSTTTIFGNYVSFFIWGDEPLAILIEDERMAKSYTNYFKLLWRIAKNEELEL